MLKVGLTGGVASGKSTVAEVLRLKGCEIVDADHLGHEAIEPGGPAYAAVIAEFGEEIAGQDGRILRPRLATLVFGHPERLARLNAIVHPAIVELAEQRCQAFLRRQPRGILVVDAALLFEAAMTGRLQKIVVVDCDPEEQVARFVARGLGTAEEARRASPRSGRAAIGWLAPTSWWIPAVPSRRRKPAPQNCTRKLVKLL